ncbi:hypothetical protein SELMODRAFT_446932 [Selaginella moellendorffii]|uniref:Uncharacterized protein n=1 Tax=Selaginella moellendorffii TaxID=88036 RepID=D8SVE1_SELML|nr:hypothetical protein SELMODRAFT_446932 [Selaginella moellendorffii]
MKTVAMKTVAVALLVLVVLEGIECRKQLEWEDEAQARTGFPAGGFVPAPRPRKNSHHHGSHGHTPDGSSYGSSSGSYSGDGSASGYGSGYGGGPGGGSGSGYGYGSSSGSGSTGYGYGSGQVPGAGSSSEDESHFPAASSRTCSSAKNVLLPNEMKIISSLGADASFPTALEFTSTADDAIPVAGSHLWLERRPGLIDPGFRQRCLNPQHDGQIRAASSEASSVEHELWELATSDRVSTPHHHRDVHSNCPSSVAVRASLHVESDLGARRRWQRLQFFLGREDHSDGNTVKNGERVGEDSCGAMWPLFL